VRHRLGSTTPEWGDVWPELRVAVAVPGAPSQAAQLAAATILIPLSDDFESRPLAARRLRRHLHTRQRRARLCPLAGRSNTVDIELRVGERMGYSAA